MVAARVLLALVDAGQLDIDALIADVLPYAADHPEITTAQLLSNSSGLPGLMATSKYSGYLCAFSHEGSLQECAEAILTTPSDDDDVVAPDTRFDFGAPSGKLPEQWPKQPRGCRGQNSLTNSLCSRVA